MPLIRPRSRLVLALAVLGAWPAPRASAEEPDGGRLAALSVSVRAARSLCFADRIEVAGTLGPREQVDVGVEREGLKVGQLLANPLDVVSAGQVLARLVPLDGPNDAASPVLVRAPVAGMVLRSQAIAGRPATSRQGPLFQIVSGGDIELQADVPLTHLARLAVGQAVVVKPLGLPDVAARIRQVEPGADPAAQVGRVRIRLSAGSEVRVGTYARGIVTVGERCGVAVPYSAVQFEAEGTVVQVVEGDRVETRQVTVGLLSGDNVEIRSGLSDADLVVVRAGAFLREGDRVEPIVVTDAPTAPSGRK